MSQAKKLSRTYDRAKLLEIGPGSKIVLMSDLHRGDGSLADRLEGNKNLYFAALTHYWRLGHTYIELGDGDELWENRHTDEIIYAHGDIFWRLAQFYRAGRLHMLYGNHDRVKRRGMSEFEFYYDERKQAYLPLFPGLRSEEGILLRDERGAWELLLTHGNQGDALSDDLWMIGRFLVRYFWRPLQLIGVHDPFDTPQNPKRQTKIAEGMSDWANKNRRLLVAGHTHRPYFSRPGEGFYFNDGSGVYKGQLNAIEVEDGKIALVKWRFMTRADGTVYAGRIIQMGPAALCEYA